jgi:hypothetical protein
MLKEVWQLLFDELRKEFPDTPILSVFGNNDNMYNYRPTPPNDPNFGGKLFQEAWKIWMEQTPKNLASKTQEQIDSMKADFQDGGWFQYDFEDINKLSLLVINSNYPATQKDPKYTQKDMVDKQFKWIESKLNDNFNKEEKYQRKFIMMMHEPPGVNYFPRGVEKTPFQEFWNEDDTTVYLKLVKKYEG